MTVHDTAAPHFPKVIIGLKRVYGGRRDMVRRLWRVTGRVSLLKKIVRDI